MPAGFFTTFISVELSFNIAYDALLKTEETAGIRTEDKVTANIAYPRN